MNKLNIVSSEEASIAKVAFVRKCLKSDIVDGKEYCIYKEGYDLKKQPKGWPKHFETESKANKYLQQMEMFKDLADKNKHK